MAITETVEGKRKATSQEVWEQAKKAKKFHNAISVKEKLLDLIKELVTMLPTNPIDQLIIELGGSEKVADLTGRRPRTTQSHIGDVRIIS